MYYNDGILPWLHTREFYTIPSGLEAGIVESIEQSLVLELAVRVLHVSPALPLHEVQACVLLLGLEDPDIVLVEAERGHEPFDRLVHLPLDGALEAGSTAALPGVVHYEAEQRGSSACCFELHLQVSCLYTVLDSTFSIKDFDFESAASSIISKTIASHAFPLIV